MKLKELVQTVTDTSPASASTAISTFLFTNLTKWDKCVIDATLLGGTGGNLDVYLQRKIATNTWRDWVHFPQIAAGASKKYTLVMSGEGGTAASIIETGGGSDATPGVALAVNTAVNVAPGGDVRVVFVAGASTSAGASQTITMALYTERY